MANPTHRNNPQGGGMMESAKDVSRTVAEKADQAAGSVGSTLKTAADKIRENAPDSGYLGTAARGVSDTLASGGRYLEREKLSGAFEDMTDVIRNNPVPALLIAVGVGFLLARAMSRS
jgi:ElaB/YqjD/DUF883 family membrane-anchored ribosome-binding protein